SVQRRRWPQTASLIEKETLNHPLCHSGKCKSWTPAYAGVTEKAKSSFIRAPPLAAGAQFDQVWPQAPSLIKNET
ncbi:MAG: hypothetical protein ACLFT8_01670, partial [Desulfovermiculus sp.]